jgi:hypothetical protein
VQLAGDPGPLPRDRHERALAGGRLDPVGTHRLGGSPVGRDA